jgi:hypothetical protein
MRGCMWKTGKSGYLSYRYLLLSRFFRAQNILASSLMSNRDVPMGNPHISILVTKSAFTYARKIFTPAVQGIKNAHLQQAHASVFGRKISLDPLSWWHMMAVWGKQHIDTYVTEPTFTNTRAHRKRAEVSLTKARIIFTNRTKKRNPIKPKSAKSTHLDEWMAQSRRETLKYAQETLFRLVICSCKVLG